VGIIGNNNNNNNNKLNMNIIEHLMAGYIMNVISNHTAVTPVFVV